MTLHETLKDQMKEAMRAKDKVRLTTIRSILGSVTEDLIKNKQKPDEVADDDLTLAVIKREAKKRADSIEQFTAAGRTELAETEEAELEILKDFLPEMMSVDAIKPLVEAKIRELGITDPSKKGMLIGALMKDLKGKADGSDVKAVVDELLS